MSTLVILTSKTEDMIVANGGTSWWVVSPRALKHVTHVVLCHNSHDPRRPGNPADHGKAFMIGEYGGYTEKEDDGRKLIKLSRVASIDIPGFWPGYRNPVWYAGDGEVAERFEGAGIDMENLAWQDMEDLKVEQPLSEPKGHAEGRFIEHVLQRARADIAEHLGMPIDQVQVNVTIETRFGV